MAAAKKRGLGRGLDALLGGGDDGAPSVIEQEGELRTLPIQYIQPGKYQPRRHWNDEALDELAASIKAQGLIQPVVVRALGKNSYELIAGERRWRAAQRAQLSELPALVKDVPEVAVPAMALLKSYSSFMVQASRYWRRSLWVAMRASCRHLVSASH